MFSWDVQKSITNFDKHGVSFEEAATVFADPEGLDVDDPDWDEPRFRRVGMSAIGRVVVVAYTLRESSDGKETIRIISARQASPKERKAYVG